MASGKKNPTRKTPPVAKQEAKKPIVPTGQDLFDRVNAWMEKNYKAFFWISIAASTILALVLFNTRLDIGGDDASYIDRTYELIKSGRFPSFQGPLYPFVLAPFVALFGINILLLKMLSVLFTVGQVYFLWKAFRRHAPAFVTVMSILLVATNYYVLSYGSLTYSEAFFMFLQAVLFWFFNTRIPENDTDVSIGTHWKPYVLLALLLTAMFLSRTVGVVAAGSVFLYFLVYRRWKSLAFSLAAFIVLMGVYMVLKSAFVSSDIQFESQGKALLLKDPYKPELGNETVSGYFKRFSDNSNLYFSKRLMQILNFKEETNIKKNAAVAFFIYVLAVLGLVRSYKRNRYVFFAGIYALSTALLTFFAIQARWDQLRLILVVLAPLSLLIFFGLYSITKGTALRALQPVVMLLIPLLLLISFGRTMVEAPKNTRILSHNLKGDIYYGYTDDWINYANMSSWIGKNIPDSEVVICRKPSMSKLFANGRQFVGLYVVPSTDPDSCYQWLADNKVDYVMDASLRRNPYKNTGQIITTIRSVLYYTSQKRPQTFTLVHTEGTKEPAYLYKVNYE